MISAVPSDRRMQQGQVFEQTRRGAQGTPVWGYRYRTGGRGSRRIQIGGFTTETAARAALERALEQARREQGLEGPISLTELVDTYLAQHDAEPVTIAKLRWLLTKSVAAFGDRPITTLRSAEIAAWRMTIPVGHRFEATQALRQVLERAVAWNMLTTNPSRVGVTNPQRRLREQRPFETWRSFTASTSRFRPGGCASGAWFRGLRGKPERLSSGTGLRAGARSERLSV
jgi:hypothetical protein